MALTIANCEGRTLKREKNHRNKVQHLFFNLLDKGGLISKGILLPKLFWTTVRKNCSSDREKILKFEAGGAENLQKFWDY